MATMTPIQELRHSAAHMLATAVLRLFPDAKLDIGPATDNGFYYDFDLDHKFTAEDLEKIEAEMKKIAKENQKFECFEVSREEAEKLIAETPALREFKPGRLADIPEGEKITFYRNGEFLDLCAGSGCIGISTLKNTRDTTAVLADLSERAIAVARENAEANGVFERCGFKILDARREAVEGELFAVLSNPPYVTDSAYLTLDKNIYFEPKMAFVGGADGGDFYRDITPLYKSRIKKGGFIAYEIGYDQEQLLRTVAAENGMAVEILHDLSGNARVAVLKG